MMTRVRFILGPYGYNALLPVELASGADANMAAAQRRLLSAAPEEDLTGDLTAALVADTRAGVFVLRDPELARTLHLWTAACEKSGHRPEAVVVMQPPPGAASHGAEDDTSASPGSQAIGWARAALEAERSTRGLPRDFVRLTGNHVLPAHASLEGELAELLFREIDSAPPEVLESFARVFDLTEAQHEQARTLLCDLEDSRRTIRQLGDLAEAMAQQAVKVAEAPMRAAVAKVERRLLLRLSRQSLLIPRRMAEKFARSAAKRDPGKLIEVARAPAMLTSGAAQSAPRQSVSRDAEFRAFAPPEPFTPDIRLLAFYLPQFHPFPENDAWWGKGFTEWTNVGKALPLFEGHHQPHCPIHLGYYDLRVPDVMEEQARLARAYGVGGFAYYFYWFAGKTLMETPLRSMLENRAVEMPFCLTWANENWTRRWDGRDNEVLIGQHHSLEDSRALIRHLAPYFHDPRYIRVDGKPLFLVYRASLIPDIRRTTDMWRTEAEAMGLGGLHLVAVQSFELDDPRPLGFDAAVEFPPHGSDTPNYAPGLKLADPSFAGHIHDYARAAEAALARPEPEYDWYRSVMLSWDNTARKPDRAHIYANFSVAAYRRWLDGLCARLRAQPDIPPDQRLIFVNAWNEWAEGTHLEPDQRFGYAYLEATADALRGQ